MLYSSLDNVPLQRCLLAVDTPTPESALRIGNEFSQLQTPRENTNVPIRCIDEPTRRRCRDQQNTTSYLDSHPTATHEIDEEDGRRWSSYRRITHQDDQQGSGTPYHQD